MKLHVLQSMAEIAEEKWDALLGTNPFTCYSFLAALEESACVCIKTGWRPMHLALWREDELLAVMPLYLKYHSYGEYVFDWAWAEAYERHELNYYPKLLSAVPFTPVTGKRIGMAEHLTEQERDQVVALLVKELDALVIAHDFSGWHCLFPDKEQQVLLAGNTRLKRLGAQFHWHNYGYRDFDAFLQTMSSRKRKNILKERRPFVDGDIVFRAIEGCDIRYSELAAFVACYQTTYAKRSGHKGYLNFDFFKRVIQARPKHLVLFRAEKIQEDGEVTLLASALFFKSETHLYGRYWGAQLPMSGLHFELCYYQGIEYCIAQNLQVFDAGAQGEHKLIRGFEPVETYSVHQVVHPDFFEAIKEFTDREAHDMQDYIASAKRVLPFKSKAG